MYHFLKHISIFFGFILLFGRSYAVDLEGFTIEISPNDIMLGEATDVTIKAISKDGIVVNDYTGDIIMTLEGGQDNDSFEIPENGIYTFTQADQGIKKFTKGLIIKKEGKYIFRVQDISQFDKDISGSVALSVTDKNDTQKSTGSVITIEEPIDGAVVQGSAISIIGVSESKNSPLEVYVDDQKINLEVQTDNNGLFSFYLDEIKEGNHSLYLKAIDYQGKVLGTSNTLQFTYIPPILDTLLHSFSATPKGLINLGSQIAIAVDTDDSIQSVELNIDGLGSFFMDRITNGKFVKNIVFNQKGLYKINTTLIFETGQKEIYEDRATIVVQGDNIVGIGTLKVVNDIVDPSKASLSRQPQGTIASYSVRYGLNQSQLDKEVKVTTTKVDILGLEIGKQYFFQVFPLNSNGDVIGKSSDVAMIQTEGQSSAGDEIVPAPSCVVVGIQVRTEKRGDQYFLVWDIIENAVEYHIYKSDYKVDSIAQMQKIATTTIPQFSYPFNTEAKQDEYTYYSVVATCADGKNLQIDNVKKVHTGPVSDMILLFFVSLMIYMLVRVYKYNS